MQSPPSAQRDWVELVERVTRIETILEDILANHLPHVNQELQWMKSRLSRPSWSVTTLLALLTSACVGLLVQLVHH